MIRSTPLVPRELSEYASHGVAALDGDEGCSTAGSDCTAEGTDCTSEMWTSDPHELSEYASHGVAALDGENCLGITHGPCPSAACWIVLQSSLECNMEDPWTEDLSDPMGLRGTGET
jgi:hypothetical protein